MTLLLTRERAYVASAWALSHSGNLLRRCYDCGYPVGKKEIFCPRCGVRQRPERIHVHYI